MKTHSVIVVRIYLVESNLVGSICSYLKDEAKIKGVSVFRAIRGFGESGEHHTSFIDLSLDLPVTIEFYDKKEKVEAALAYLNNKVKPEHIVFWEAQVNI